VVKAPAGPFWLHVEKYIWILQRFSPRRIPEKLNSSFEWPWLTGGRRFLFIDKNFR
jgi:hypothetical protein